MKKISVLFVALVAMMATFTSCEDLATGSDVLITVVTEDVTALENEAYTVTFNVTATDSKIDDIEIRKDGSNFIVVEDIDKTTNIVTFTDSSEVADVIDYLIIVTDKDGVETEETITVTISSATTDLAEATSFEWTRVAGADATGLDMFGLAWTLNTAEKVIIKNAATKLVVLTAEDWTSITTVEALKVAVDAASDVADIRTVSATADATYNDVIATIKDDVYYMIHITSSTVETGDAGTTIKIMGESKK